MILVEEDAQLQVGGAVKTPRLGFIGLGWIGRDRMAALLKRGIADVAALLEPDEKLLEEACSLVPDAARPSTFEELLSLSLDGVVIATPNALHAAQSIRALEAGLAVFCQKPLGRTAAETARVVDAAAGADRLLAVDLSYRHAKGIRQMRDLVRSGAIGRVYAVDLVFHNAYGPNKPWFYDPALSGGGCLIDLGVHLVDIALWSLGFPEVLHTTGRLFEKGEPVMDAAVRVEDYALARLDLASGATVNLACSWHLPAGRDCVIEVRFFGTEGGLSLRNVDGSFTEFVTERFTGTRTEWLTGPPDAWGGGAVAAWAERLAADSSFDPEVRQVVDVARVLDRIYGRDGMLKRSPAA